MSDSKIDLSELSFEELETLMDDAGRRIRELREERKEEIRRQCRVLAAEIGETVESLFALPSPTPKRSKVKPKYRNPNPPHETWSGRGKQPRWFADALASGLSREDLLMSEPH